MIKTWLSIISLFVVALWIACFMGECDMYHRITALESKVAGMTYIIHKDSTYEVSIKPVPPVDSNCFLCRRCAAILEKRKGK
jgi:hypothetical protein